MGRAGPGAKGWPRRQRVYPGVLLLALPWTARALELEAGDATLTFGGLLQTQVTSEPTFPGAPDIRIRRARLSADLRVNDWLLARLEPDFAFTPTAFNNAFVQLDLDRRLSVRLGRHDRPFGLLDAIDARDVLPIERGARFGDRRTLDHYVLLEEMAYAGRSLGADARGELLESLRYTVGYYRGGLAEDEGDADVDQVAGRLAMDATDDFTIGAGFTNRAFLSPDGSTRRRGSAVQLDLAWGEPRRQGVFVLFTGSAGVFERFPDTHYWSAQTWLAYRTGSLSDRITALQPLIRLSWGAPGGEATEDGGLLITPGLGVILGDHGRLRLDCDLWLPRALDAVAGSLKGQAEVSF